MAPCLVPSELLWEWEGGLRQASRLQGPSHCPPQRAPPWTRKMAQRPQLPSQAVGRGGQAASCVLQAPNPPVPQTPPPDLALWGAEGRPQAALTARPGRWSWGGHRALRGALARAPGPSSPCPRLSALRSLSAVCLPPARPPSTGGEYRPFAWVGLERVEVPPSRPWRGPRLRNVVGSRADPAWGLCQVQAARAPRSAAAPVQRHWGPGGLGAFDSGRSPRSHAEQ